MLAIKPLDPHLAYSLFSTDLPFPVSPICYVSAAASQLFLLPTLSGQPQGCSRHLFHVEETFSKSTSSFKLSHWQHLTNVATKWLASLLDALKYHIDPLALLSLPLKAGAVVFVILTHWMLAPSAQTSRIKDSECISGSSHITLNWPPKSTFLKFVLLFLILAANTLCV